MAVRETPYTNILRRGKGKIKKGVGARRKLDRACFMAKDDGSGDDNDNGKRGPVIALVSKRKKSIACLYTCPRTKGKREKKRGKKKKP
jgi:hypothetical protein